MTQCAKCDKWIKDRARRGMCSTCYREMRARSTAITGETRVVEVRNAPVTSGSERSIRVRLPALPEGWE